MLLLICSCFTRGVWMMTQQRLRRQKRLLTGWRRQKCCMPPPMAQMTTGIGCMLLSRQVSVHSCLDSSWARSIVAVEELEGTHDCEPWASLMTKRILCASASARPLSCFLLLDCIWTLFHKAHCDKGRACFVQAFCGNLSGSFWKLQHWNPFELCGITRLKNGEAGINDIPLSASRKLFCLIHRARRISRQQWWDAGSSLSDAGAKVFPQMEAKASGKLCLTNTSLTFLFARKLIRTAVCKAVNGDQITSTWKLSCQWLLWTF